MWQVRLRTAISIYLLYFYFANINTYINREHVNVMHGAGHCGSGACEVAQCTQFGVFRFVLTFVAVRVVCFCAACIWGNKEE